MKALVATKITQNPAVGDFCFAAEGELVYESEKCNSPQHPDCPYCDKALAGVHSRCFTNTVKVVDVKGFIEEIDVIHESIPGLREVAELYEPGAVLEVRPDGFFLRQG